MEIADSFDFSDGDMAVCDWDGVRRPALDTVDAAESVADVECTSDFADRVDGGGLF